MRFLRLLVAVSCVALGAIVGVLNRQLVVVDYAFGRLSTSLGVALIAALLLGIIVGGLAAVARRARPASAAPAGDRAASLYDPET